MIMYNHNLEKGQGLVEYALILVLVAVVVIASLTTVGDKITYIFGEVSVALDPGSGPACTKDAHKSAKQAGDAQHDAWHKACKP